jgi:spermidine synthase
MHTHFHTQATLHHEKKIQKYQVSALIVAAIFFTGFASLSYQVVIERLIKLVIGGTAVSSFIVTFVTLVGMGIGALTGILPREKKWLSYSAITFVSACYTVLSAVIILPLLQFLSQQIIMRHIESTLSQMILYSTAVLCILPAAILSGAVIPKIMGYARRDFFRSAGFLYGTYTIGSALSIYVLVRIFLPLVDFRITFLIIAGIFMTAAALTRWIDRTTVDDRLRETPNNPVRRNHLLMQFLSSTLAIILEISVFRAVSVTWGSSSPYAYPFALLTYLVAYAAGSYIIPPLYKRVFPHAGLAPIFLLLPLVFVASLLLPKTIPDQGLLSLFFIGGIEHAGLIAFLSGAFFPLLLGEGNAENIEKNSSVLSFVSSMGTLLGGLFLLLIGFPLLGMRLSILIAFAGYLYGAVVLLTAGDAKKYYSLLSLTLLLLLAFTPQTMWSGWIHRQVNPHMQYVEGQGGIALINWTDDSRTSGSVVINGTIASFIPYLVNHATLAALSSGAPNKDRVLILGVGGGGIVRDVLEFPHVRAVDAVEWSRELIMLLGTPTVSDVIADPLKDSRVTVFATDAKTYANAAASVNKSYTLIIDNLTVIGWSGSTPIRSVEYFRSMMPLLSDDGVYIILMHHNTDAQYAAAVAGLTRVCPIVASYDKKYVICAKQEIAWNLDYMDETLETYSKLPSLQNTLRHTPRWLFEKYETLDKEAYTQVEPIHDMMPYFEYEEFAVRKK